MSARDRRRQVAAVATTLRDLRIELALLTHRVGSRVELRDLDLDCLDVITRYGPLTAGAVAARVGVHAATMTGVLSRLEAGGWITREPAPGDRRAVQLTSTTGRQGELYRLFEGMNSRLERICAAYSEDELATIVDFLRRAADAGAASVEELA